MTRSAVVTGRLRRAHGVAPDQSEEHTSTGPATVACREFRAFLLGGREFDDLMDSDRACLQ